MHGAPFQLASPVVRDPQIVDRARDGQGVAGVLREAYGVNAEEISGCAVAVDRDDVLALDLDHAHQEWRAVIEALQGGLATAQRFFRFLTPASHREVRR